MPQTCTPLAEIGALASQVIVESVIVFRVRSRGRWRVLGFERVETGLSCVYVGEQVIVVIEEICDINQFQFAALLRRSGILTQLGDVCQALRRRLPGLLEIFSG